MSGRSYEEQVHEGDELERARRVVEANRALIDEIERDRPREEAITMLARSRLRRAQELIRRASSVPRAI
jgi:hypothetical protein